MNLSQALADLQNANNRICRPLLALEASLGEAIDLESKIHDAQVALTSIHETMVTYEHRIDQATKELARLDAEREHARVTRDEAVARAQDDVRRVSAECQRDMANVRQSLSGARADAMEHHARAMQTLAEELKAATGKRDAMLREIEALRARFT